MLRFRHVGTRGARALHFFDGVQKYILHPHQEHNFREIIGRLSITCLLFVLTLALTIVLQHFHTLLYCITHLHTPVRLVCFTLTFLNEWLHTLSKNCSNIPVRLSFIIMNFMHTIVQLTTTV